MMMLPMERLEATRRGLAIAAAGCGRRIGTTGLKHVAGASAAVGRHTTAAARR